MAIGRLFRMGRRPKKRSWLDSLTGPMSGPVVPVMKRNTPRRFPVRTAEFFPLRMGKN